MRILLVDDNMDNAESLAVVIRLMGHEVKLARGVEDGKVLLAAGRLDAAVIDWCLAPGDVDDGDGSLILWARSQGIGIPIVILTGSLAIEVAKLAALQEAGVVLLHKPIEPEAMMAALEVMLQGRKLVEVQPGKPDSWFDPNPL